ncbi:MAG: hypothetical protein VR68_11710 [Peptococcaceae bacterium BRH_c4a]|nr:MAG: hypothetical protein VR68_11710 [Peptococcaceae bacterium BRH_c4a]
MPRPLTTTQKGADPDKSKKRKPQRLPKVISREEAKLILSLPNIKTKIGLRNRTILQVLYRQGLRVQELCNLTLKDVDTQQGFIYVQAGKGNKDRVTPMDPETILWCKKWAEKRPMETNWFFPSLQGTALDQRYIRAMVADYGKKAGVYIQDGKKQKSVHPHCFRHTCFTEMLEENFVLTDIQQMAGHSDLKTSCIYLHVRPHALAAKIRARQGVDV